MAHHFGDLHVYHRVVELYHFTNNVVRELIINELFDVFNHLINESALLTQTSSLEASLHDTAPLFIPGNLQGVGDDRLVDGLLMLVLGQDFQARLHHMVAVDVH